MDSILNVIKLQRNQLAQKKQEQKCNPEKLSQTNLEKDTNLKIRLLPKYELLAKKEDNIIKLTFQNWEIALDESKD